MNKQKVCVITGAAGGIGTGIAKKFYHNDYAVVLFGRNEESCKAVIEKNGLDAERVTYKVVDVSSEQQVKSAIADTKATFGRIDALVNAAAITGTYNFTENYGFDNFKRVYEVNVYGTFLTMMYVLPIMKEQGKGAIVNFGSVSGMTGYTYEIGYGSSKWAVIGMTKNVANEYAQFGIRANSVSPGWVNTKMMKTSVENYIELTGDGSITLAPIGRHAEPFEIANAAYYLCSDEASYINGTNLLVDGGMMLG